MTAYETMIDGIIRSLREEPEKWTFDEHTADHPSGIRLWIANTPVLDLYIYKPTRVRLTFRDRVRVYRALAECRAKHITSKLHPSA